LVDLQKICVAQGCTLSEEAEDEILFAILNLMGPKLATKAVDKCKYLSNIRIFIFNNNFNL